MTHYIFNNIHDVCENPDRHVVFIHGRQKLIIKCACYKGTWTTGHDYMGHDHGSARPVHAQITEHKTANEAVIDEIKKVLNSWGKNIDPRDKAAALQYINSLNQFSLF